MQCREKVFSHRNHRCGQRSVKAKKRVDAHTYDGGRIQDLVNQSGTISSMVETPAMLLHTITTIALAPLVLGNIIQQ